MAFTLNGYVEDGRQALESAVPRIEAGGDLVVLWRALSNLSESYKHTGKLEDALAYAQRSLDIAEQRLGSPAQTGFILGNVGHLLLLAGRDGQSHRLDGGDLHACSSRGRAPWPGGSVTSS